MGIPKRGHPFPPGRGLNPDEIPHAARDAETADIIAAQTCATCGDDDHRTAEHASPVDAIPNDYEED